MVEQDGSQKLPDVGAYIREQRRKAQLSLRKLAERAGVSNPYLSQIERGVRQPSAKILKGIATALQVSAESLFTQAGILDGSPDGRPHDVLRAVWRDPDLTDGQRRELAELYERFRIETLERRTRRQASQVRQEEEGGQP
ncbi:MAG: helix-turn-helix domain-containing protein [Candidatus Binatia bacterium]